MDQRLVAWARAVKSRRRGAFPPPLWLFTDPARLPDPLGAIGRLPRGLCGVVLREDGPGGRPALLARARRLCRARRLLLAVAAEGPLAGGRGTGRHLRRGRRGRGGGTGLTASAHGVAELVRARRAGVGAIFLSPCLPTASHPGQPALGVLRWAGLARRAGRPVLALGGIDGASARRLPRWVAGAGAIGALR